jgi:hypothetical protein
MSKPSPEIEALAAERLAAEESRITGSRRTTVSLGTTFAEFWKHPSPWMISATIVTALGWRIVEGDWQVSDLWAPVVLVALFPVLEWVIHVFILHFRPRKVAGIRIDSELARDHRRHHADPRNIPLVFIPWRSLIAVIAGDFAISLFAFPRLGQGLTFLFAVGVTGLLYEWAHHRLHHYKNEHYWFTVTSSATADRLFGTYPDPGTVKASATAKNLHGSNA